MFRVLGQFIRNVRTTGAVVPSSRALTKLYIENAELENAKTIVEFGPGTGSITRKILKHKNPDAKFFTIEINPYFSNIIKKELPEVKLYEDSAVNLKKYLDQNNIEKVDVIISSLPWSFMKKEDCKAILDESFKHLNKDGRLLTFLYLNGAYIPSGIKFTKDLRSRSSKLEKTKTTWKTFPPAFVLKAIK